jgi:DNA-binding MarR family transcriptional regulator
MKRSAAEKDRPVERDGLVDALAQSAFATMAVLSKLSAENDVSLTQLRVLAILRDRRLTMNALGEYLGLGKSTMSGLVERAEKRGLLARAPNAEDGRVVDVFLGRTGVAFAKRLSSEIQQALAPMIGVLTAVEQQRLRVLLERMLVSKRKASAR